MKFLPFISAAAVLISASPAFAAPPSTPPNCSAIAFRPLLANSGDGDQDVGLYKSRFGRIEVKASVKGGATQTYFVQIDGKPLQAAGQLPGAIALCAKAKRLPPPAAPDPACTGDQLQVLNVHTGDKRYVLLYAHHSVGWHFCSAGTS